MTKYFFLFLFFCISSFGFAQSFTNSPNCVKAYNNIIALKIDSGKYFIAQEKRVNPTNLYVLLLENYIDFLSIYTSGRSAEIELKQTTFDNRTKAIKNSNKTDSPYFLYIQAEIQLQTAILLVQNNEYLSTVFYLRRALKLLEENVTKFPNFKANNKSLGVLYSILGSVPDSFKTGLSIIGLNGDIKQGMLMLKTLTADKSFEYQHETATIYAFMLLHLNNDKEAAWQVLKLNNFFYSASKMDAYSIGHIGIYGSHCDDGILTLSTKVFPTDKIKMQMYILPNF